MVRFKSSISALFMILICLSAAAPAFGGHEEPTGEAEAQDGKVVTTQATDVKSQPEPETPKGQSPAAGSRPAREFRLLPEEVDWGRAIAISGFAVLLVSGLLFFLDAKGRDSWAWLRSRLKGERSNDEDQGPG